MNIRDYIKSNFVVVGHRGLPSEFVENTVESFENAFKYTDIVELDVHLSTDNEVYVIHDFNLKRLASIDKDIENIESTEIDKIMVRGHNIPKLRDLFKLFRDKYFLVELKTVHDDGYLVKNELTKYTLQVVESMGMEDHVCIISFDPYALRRAGELSRTIMLGFDYDQHSEKYIGKIDCKDLKSMGVSLFLPEYKKEYMKKFKEIQEDGYFVVPWTVDRERDSMFISDSGLNGYITNMVDKMSKLPR